MEESVRLSWQNVKKSLTSAMNFAQWLSEMRICSTDRRKTLSLSAGEWFYAPPFLYTALSTGI